jgi:hypothetical protein
VYQAGLELVAWLETMWNVFSCSADLRTKLDKSTTAIVLNIAEGNGRFTGKDQVSFYSTAYKATLHSVSLVDVAGANFIPSSGLSVGFVSSSQSLAYLAKTPYEAVAAIISPGRPSRNPRRRT